jgi:plastocyanin
MIPRTMTYAVFAAFLAAAPALADDAHVTMKNFDFMPMQMTVAAGTTVTWTNQDGEPHTVVSTDGTFRSAALDQNDSFKFTFSKPGTYKYICSIHPKMVGTVTVK